MAVSKELLEIVACPRCRGPLDDGGDCLVCPACSVSYPIENGIPVLLADQGKPC